MSNIFKNDLYSIGNNPNKEECINFDSLEHFDKFNENYIFLREKCLKFSWSQEKSEDFAQSSMDKKYIYSENINLCKGEKLYAFCHSDIKGPFRNNKSPFYMSESMYNKILMDKNYYDDGKWKVFNLKNTFALPCSNSCNTIVTREISQDHQGVEVGIAAATEEVRLIGRYPIVDDNIYMRDMNGGGSQTLADSSKLMDCQFQPVSTNYINERVEKQREMNVKIALEADAVLAQGRKGAISRNSEAYKRADEHLDGVSTAIASDPYSKRLIPKGLVDDIEKRTDRQQKTPRAKQLETEKELGH